MDLSKAEKKKQPKITADTSDSQMNQHVVVPNETPPVIMVGEGVESNKADEAIPQQGELVSSQFTLVDAPIRPRQRSCTAASPSTGKQGASVPVFGDWNPALADGYTVIFSARMANPALADGYRYLSNHILVDRESCITRNIDINSTHPHNSLVHPTKHPKQGSCFSWLLGR